MRHSTPKSPIPRRLRRRTANPPTRFRLRAMKQRLCQQPQVASRLVLGGCSIATVASPWCSGLQPPTKTTPFCNRPSSSLWCCNCSQDVYKKRRRHKTAPAKSRWGCSHAPRCAGSPDRLVGCRAMSALLERAARHLDCDAIHTFRTSSCPPPADCTLMHQQLSYGSVRHTPRFFAQTCVEYPAALSAARPSLGRRDLQSLDRVAGGGHIPARAAVPPLN